MLVRIPYKINAPHSYCYLSKVFFAEKRYGAIQNLFMKKRRKEKKS
jgi:hypothetical protein